MSYNVSTKQITETVAPIVEPVSLAAMKAHLRVDGSESDTLINAQIIAAREYVEKEIQKALVQRTYRADIAGFDSVIYLPMYNLSSITQIQYYNTDSPQVLTTLDSAVYSANTAFSFIYIASGQTVESTAYRHDAVQITFVSGYEPSTDSPQDLAGNVPAGIVAAIKLIVGDLFENRETNSQMRIQPLPTTQMLLSKWREY